MNAKKEILLGVTGGVSAYKSADLLRRLQESGFAITVAPTRASLNFVGEALWESLSGRPVAGDLWSNIHEVPHIKLAHQSDLILVAPATADFLARVCHGEASDLLTATILASTSRKIFVPAMHTEMWQSPSTQENVRILRERGIVVIEPDHGRMTGEDVGQGRYPETAKIISKVNEILTPANDLAGVEILVTAGGTRESIDPVRFIGNSSSGKQGIAFAESANARGASVTLIAANMPEYSHPQIDVKHVRSAAEMLDAVLQGFDSSDVLIMTAAVADAKPKTISNVKIEKAQYQNIELEPTVDILVRVSERKRDDQVLFGFAAQTDDHIAKAHAKLSRKGLNFIYVNDVSSGKIFGSDLTQGSILHQSGKTYDFNEMSKSELASKSLDLIVAELGLRP